MVTKSKLKMALDAERGVDYAKEKQKKLRKQAEKAKKAKEIVDGVKRLVVNGKKEQKSGEDTEKAEEEEDDEEIPQLVHADAERQYVSSEEFDSGLEETESEFSEDEEEGENEDAEGDKDKEEAEEEEEEEEDDDDEEYSDVELSDIENEDDLTVPDIIPHQRLTINNTTALLSSLSRISLPSSLPFSEHLSLTSSTPTSIPDIHDDLSRELAFYTQALNAVKESRQLLHKEGVPFARPNDYFAEMVKTDEHMGKIKQKLVDEAADKKAAAEARKLRDLRKFGKQVQVAKLQEREKQKKDTLEKINALKRKRASGDTPFTTSDDADMFDVALEEASKPSKTRSRSSGTGQPNTKRQKKNEKFGFGGKKRYSKSNDATSSGDITGFNLRANKARGFGKGSGGGKKKRPGKSVRAGRRG